MEDRDPLIAGILAIELEMFVAVNGDLTAACQEQPETFLDQRRAQFAAWPVDALASYLEDLRTAQAAGENLMTLKYARMDGLIPAWNQNPLIDEVVSLAVEWQRAMFARFPALMSRARPLTPAETDAEMTSFETYARGEYETYSGMTLELLHRWMLDMRERGENMSELVYRRLVRDAGFDSLEQANRYLAGRTAS